MHHSILSIPRQFFGPGKRGSLSEKRASQSEVHVMFNLESNNEPQLGYVSLGSPYVITQILVNEASEYRVTLPKESAVDYSAQVAELMRGIRNWDGKAQQIIEPELGPAVIIGLHKGKWYIAARDAANIVKASDFADLLRKGEFNQNRQVESEGHVQAHQSLTFNLDSYFRVTAKIAFNYLCMTMGKDFVLQTSFNPIRHWIWKGGDHQFVFMADSAKVPADAIFNRILPKDCHRLTISNSKEGLVAIVSYYGNAITNVVKLAQGPTLPHALGLICDWRNQRDISLEEYWRLISSA
jgi:hypothetical protein